MIVFYKAEVSRKANPIVKRSVKKPRRILLNKKLTKNNKAFLRVLGFKV